MNAPGLNTTASYVSRAACSDIDQLAFVIALCERDLYVRAHAPRSRTSRLDLREPRGPVDRRLTTAEEIEVWAVEHENPLHASTPALRLRPRDQVLPDRRVGDRLASPHTGVHPRSTNRTCPPLAFLSECIASRSASGASDASIAGSPSASRSAILSPNELHAPAARPQLRAWPRIACLRRPRARGV